LFSNEMSSTLKKKVIELFQGTYNCAPTVLARAPGRVEVLGNHTDYNEGFVISCAINREIYVAAGPGQGKESEFISDSFPEKSTVSLDNNRKSNHWTDYPFGVCREFEKKTAVSAIPFRFAMCGNIPPGAGLSSSAALEVATALALTVLYDKTISRQELATLCQQAENDFVGMKCGLLDQFSSLFGKKDHLLFIDFRTLDHELIPLPSPPPSLVIAASGVSHSLVDSAYNQRREDCFTVADFFNEKSGGVSTLRDISTVQLQAEKAHLPKTAYHRALHITGENERVVLAKKFLQDNDLKSFGSLLYSSHQSSIENFENSCPELNELVQIAREDSRVLGSRLTGGGFGGATVTLLPQPVLSQFCNTLQMRYEKVTGLKTTIYPAQANDGASIDQG